MMLLPKYGGYEVHTMIDLEGLGFISEQNIRYLVFNFLSFRGPEGTLSTPERSGPSQAASAYRIPAAHIPPAPTIL